MKKSSRRRIDVNVDELDRIIDTAMRGPLNEAEGHTLRAAVHAMAERLVRRRNTEKTSAVLEPKTPPAAVDTPPEPEKPLRAGHGRNGADAFRARIRLPSRIPRFTPAMPVPDAEKEKCIARRNRRRWSASSGRHL